VIDRPALPVPGTLTQDPQVTGEFEQYGWYAPRLFRRGWEDNGPLAAAVTGQRL